MSRIAKYFLLLTLLVMVAVTGCKRKAKPGDVFDSDITDVDIEMPLGDSIPIDEFFEADDPAAAAKSTKLVADDSTRGGHA